MRISDTFKFNHHALTTPTVTPLNIIVNATRTIATAVQCRGDKPPDELQAMEHLRALTTGSIDAPSNQAIGATKQANNTIITKPPPQDQEPDPETAPQPFAIAPPVDDCDFTVFTTNIPPDADNAY